MSNKKRNNKRQIKLPSRLHDHVVGNMSNNRDGVVNDMGCEGSRDNNKGGKNIEVELTKVLRDEELIDGENEKIEVMLTSQKVETVECVGESSMGSGDKGISSGGADTSATTPATPTMDILNYFQEFTSSYQQKYNLK